ncbi:MAG: methylated-DNA--[protein]-cysteine S-methyltransferase [Gaiellales bacterium]|nr:MAG: methylated-DNA--[protein]-cysteine S-methyltransferase [Gaiellales bacterium]
MEKETYATSYSTSCGDGFLLWQKGMLVGHLLPGTPAPDSRVVSLPGNDGERQRALADMLESYFAGAVMDFDLDTIPLSLSGVSAFARDVSLALMEVRYGRSTTYASLAAAAGHPGAARAVGSVMAANPWPVIVPCHRVIRSDGGLGGFSRGMAWKRRLLAIEGCAAEVRD